MARLFDPEWFVPREIAFWEAVWVQCGLTAAAWRCWRLARTWEQPVPESVLAEFDRIAAAIGAGSFSVEEAGRVLTGSRRGQRDPSAALARWERDREYALAVAVLRHGGATENSAVATIAAGDYETGRIDFTGDRLKLVPVVLEARSPDVVREAVRHVRKLEKTIGTSSAN